jgi:mannose-6-phosphate isomerase-like protein (cupin superfamily)
MSVMTPGPGMGISHREAEIAAEWFVERVAATAMRSGDSSTATALVERSARGRGLMAPLYAHREDEAYYVVSGVLTFFVGEEVVRARSGDVVVAPPDVPRTFRVDSDEARWLVVTRVGSVSRFEDFGRALARPSPAHDADWPRGQEASGLVAIAAANGIRILGAPGALPSDV